MVMVSLECPLQCPPSKAKTGQAVLPCAALSLLTLTTLLFLAVSAAPCFGDYPRQSTSAQRDLPGLERFVDECPGSDIHQPLQAIFYLLYFAYVGPRWNFWPPLSLG
eukprot:4194040-Karenia_brevis.AAC.1